MVIPTYFAKYFPQSMQKVNLVENVLKIGTLVLHRNGSISSTDVVLKNQQLIQLKKNLIENPDKNAQFYMSHSSN